jgi:hypothetical protein
MDNKEQLFIRKASCMLRTTNRRRALRMRNSIPNDVSIYVD